MLFKAFHRRIPLEDRTIKSWLLPHLLCIHSAIADWYLPQIVIICKRSFSLEDFSPLKLTQTHFFKNAWMSRNWRITLCVFGFIPYCVCDFETKIRARLIWVIWEKRIASIVQRTYIRCTWKSRANISGLFLWLLCCILSAVYHLGPGYLQ